MSYLFMLLLGPLALVNLCAFAFFLWWASQICQVHRSTAAAVGRPSIGISFRRALAVVLGWAGCGKLSFLLLWCLVPVRSEYYLRLAALAMIVQFGLLLALVRLFVSPTAGRTVLVALLTESLCALYGVGLVLVVGLGLVLASGYVQPTGSMAETLLGYHKDVTCPTCGYEFVVNCSAEADPPEGSRPMRTFACVCPNCRQRIHFPSSPSSYREEHPDSVLIDDPAVQRGDRFFAGPVLVGPYITALHRFDLVIHEFPFRRSFTYVKRLVGLPGETLAINGGDLYVLPADKARNYDAAESEQTGQDESEAKALMHINDPEATRLFEQRQFEILRKSPEQILSLRRLVYDNDHPAKDQPLRWKSEGWNEFGNGFRCETGSAERVAWLRYHHYVRDFPGKPSLITDIMGNNTYQSNLHFPLLGENWCGDLILECEATIDNPQGELTLELSRGLDRFQARWDLSTGSCTLLRISKDGEQKLESKATALKKKGSYRLRFANVDQRLVVWVDGDLPFDNGVSYAPPEDCGPRKENDLEPASIGVRGAAVTIQKLKLFRDTYYTIGGAKQGMPHEADVRDFDPTDPIGGRWEDLKNPPFVTMYVQPGHFFVLGDNSPESSDSRSWGLVSHRLLLGRAFFVYYPFQRVGVLR